MNVYGRALFVVSFLVSASLADTPPCRDLKSGITSCDPYSMTPFKVVRPKKDIRSLRHKPVTKKEIPVADKIKVKNGISLHSLINKYIKREERLYSRTEKQERSQNLPLEHEPTEMRLQPQEILAKKKEENLSVQKKETAEEKPEEIPKTIVLVPAEQKPISGILEKEDANTSQESQLESEVILPAEPIHDKREKNIGKNKDIKEFAVYIVRKGDTLATISNKFGLDIDNLIKINDLQKRQSLKVGQKLFIPLSQEKMDILDSAFYIVKKGDTLSSIAKKFNVKISDLQKYNKIKKRSIIYIGQGLILPLPHKLVELKMIEKKKRQERLRKKRERERLAKIALKKKERARFLKISKGLRHKISVIATAYTSHGSQTDKTPFVAAWNNRIRPGMKIIAVSRDLIYRYGLRNGTKVRISGLRGIYTVRDKMHKKWRRRIDIYMGMSRWRALRWGRRRVTLYY